MKRPGLASASDGSTFAPARGSGLNPYDRANTTFAPTVRPHAWAGRAALFTPLAAARLPLAPSKWPGWPPMRSELDTVAGLEGDIRRTRVCHQCCVESLDMDRPLLPAIEEQIASLCASERILMQVPPLKTHLVPAMSCAPRAASTQPST